MNKRKEQYVQADFVRKISQKADIIILLGQRSNGKGFACRQLVIEDFVKKGDQFAYLRRWDLDAKDNNTTQYFNDVPYISNLTDGNSTLVDVYHHDIYLSHFDPDKLKVIHDKKCGRAFGLSIAERYKSQSFPQIKNIIFEEFITNRQYLNNEVQEFDNFRSTIFRTRPGCKVYMIGNKLSRVNPYLREYGLTHVSQQKNGTVEYYKKGDTTVAVYMTEVLQSNKTFFGNNAKAINAGEWETKEYQHLDNFKEFEPLYTMVVNYKGNMFLCQFGKYVDDLVTNSKGYIWFIQPKTSSIQPNTRVICDRVSSSTLYTTTLRGLTANEQFIFNLLKAGEVVFSDNLTGTEFNQILDYIR